MSKVDSLKHFDVLGVKVSAINMEDACVAVEETIAQNKKGYVCVCPVSTVMECQNDSVMLKSVNTATVVTPDGMPVVWLGKMKGHNGVSRVYGPDLMLEVCRISAAKGYKNYFYGSNHNVLERLQERLKTLFPGFVVSGAYSPPFRKLSKEEDNEIIRMINETKPDILWVGLGSPKQDIWMYEHKDKLNVAVMLGVGAAFDFISETKLQAPKFMQKIGLEWLFRLSCEPKRLWKRYLIGNPLFIYLICREFVRSIHRKH